MVKPILFIRVFDNLFRTLVGNNESYDQKFSIAELEYNPSVNKTTNMSPYEYGIMHKQSVGLILVANYHRVFEFVSSSTSCLHDLHKKINFKNWRKEILKIEESNADYKLRTNLKKQFKTFNVGD